MTNKFDDQQNYHTNVTGLHDILAELGSQPDDEEGSIKIVNNYILEPSTLDKRNLKPEQIAELQAIVSELNELQDRMRKLDCKFHDVTDQYC